MNKKSLIPLLGVAFVVAVLSTWVFYSLVAGKLAQPAKASVRRVVVAAKAISRGATVSSDDVKTREWKLEMLPEGSYQNTAQVVGTVAVEAIKAEEALTTSRVVGNGNGGPGVAIPAGMRAVSIQPDDSSGVMALLRAGSRVDVQFVRLKGNESGEVEVRTLFERVAVFHVLKEGDGGRGTPHVATLLLTRAEAEKLAAADSRGKIRLTLRNPVEGEEPGLVSKSEDGPGETPTGGSQSARAATDYQLEIRLARLDGQGQNGGSPKLVRLPAGSDSGYEIVGVSRATTSGGKPVQVTAQAAGHGLRLRARPVSRAGQKTKMWLESELSWKQGEGTATRRVQGEIEVGEGESVLASGLSGPTEPKLVVLVRAKPLK